MPSKLCPHCLIPTPEARLMVAAGSPMVKLVNDFGPAKEYLALNPDLVIIGRGYSDYYLLDQLNRGDTPRTAATYFVEEQYNRYYRYNPAVTLWEGHNEPSFGAPDDPRAREQMAWYGEFEAYRLQYLAQLGLRGVVGNFSTGYPEVKRDPRMWEAFLPAIYAAKQYNGLLGVHEYSGPFMWWGSGRYQHANCDGTLREDIGRRGWLTLRYRHYYEDILAPRGLGDVPLVITEMGTDAVGGSCPGAPTGAWKDLVSYWSQHDGQGDPIDYWRTTAPGQRDPERFYAEQLMWYDRELQKDSYVVGAALFTVGTDHSRWHKYDVAGTQIPALLADHIRLSASQPIPVNQPAPETPPAVRVEPAPTQPPEPEAVIAPAPISTPAARRGHPRVQYSRVYVLLPPGLADPDWVAAIAEHTWPTHRLTIGGSADDAGIGNLHARAVVAVNPAAWGDDPPLQDWFTQHYPGVTFITIQASNLARLHRTLANIKLSRPQLVRNAPPQVETGRPRQSYARRYVLFNPTQTGAEWIAAAAHHTWAGQRLTLGGSADDAGVGDLSTREVFAINPHEGWQGDLQQWFATHYPGVRYHAITGQTPLQVAQNLAQVVGERAVAGR